MLAPYNFKTIWTGRMVGESEIVQHGKKKYHLAVDLRAFVLSEETRRTNSNA